MATFSSIPSGFNFVRTLLDKPPELKLSDFTGDTSFLDELVANARRRGDSGRTFDRAFRPALRAITAAEKRTVSDIEAGFAKAGAPAGAKAQARLSAGETTIEALSEAGERGRQLQLDQNRLVNENIERLLATKTRIESEGERRFDVAKREQKARRKSELISAGLGFASGGLSDIFGVIGEGKQREEAISTIGAIGDTDLTIEDIEALVSEKQIQPSVGVSLAQNVRSVSRTETANIEKFVGDLQTEFGATVDDKFRDFASQNLANLPEGADLTSLSKALETGAIDREEFTNFLNKEQVNLSFELSRDISSGAITAEDALEKFNKGIITQSTLSDVFKNIPKTKKPVISDALKKIIQTENSDEQQAIFDDALTNNKFLTPSEVNTGRSIIAGNIKDPDKKQIFRFSGAFQDLEDSLESISGTLPPTGPDTPAQSSLGKIKNILTNRASQGITTTESAQIKDEIAIFVNALDDSFFDKKALQSQAGILNITFDANDSLFDKRAKLRKSLISHVNIMLNASGGITGSQIDTDLDLISQ